MHDAEQWNHAYEHGRHGEQSRAARPGAELAGIVAMLGDERGAAIDIGCGAGTDAVYLAERGFDVIGIDGSSKALELAAELASERGVTVSWVEGSALELPAADGSVAAAFDRGCMHHVPAGDHPRYIAELARVVRPGGRVFLRDVTHPGHHPTPVTSDGLERLVRDTPLELESIVPFEMAGPHGASPATLAVLVRR